MTNELEKQLKADILEDIVTALKDSQHAFNRDYILADRFIRILESKIKGYRDDNRNWENLFWHIWDKIEKC